MSAIDMTVDEIIASLKRTSLPTVVVEGKDDLIVYRRFEERLMDVGVSVLPVGGRTKVLEIFSRRTEITSVEIAFIADMDFFVHSGVPTDFDDKSLFFTEGYSIENDAYRDGQLSNILSAGESECYTISVEKIVHWYSLAMSRHLAGFNSNLSLHPGHVLANYENLVSLEDGESYPVQLKSQILKDYPKLLRGKTLLALLVSHASYKGRDVRHNTKILLEMVAVKPGPLLNDLFDRVRDRFEA